MSEARVLVLDNGSDSTKVGFAGDTKPKNVFKTIVGRPKRNLSEMCDRDAYIGEEAITKRGLLTLNFPIEHGTIHNWDDMEKLWFYSFKNVLKATPEEYPVLLTESSLNPTKNRETTTQMMFETFLTPALYLGAQSALSLFSVGISTGVVLDSGIVTHSVPIYEGHAVQHAIERTNFGGRELNEYLLKMLVERGFCVKFSGTNGGYDITPNIKHSVCYVALDFDREMMKETKDFEQQFKLPDGYFIKYKDEGPITIENERFRCPEALFQPNLLGLNCDGIHESILNSIKKCDSEIRGDLFNIVLSGGNTMFKGISERLEKEIVELAPSTKIKVIAPTEREYSSWIGGSMFASLSTFQQMCISKEEYDELGPCMVHRKCF